MLPMPPRITRPSTWIDTMTWKLAGVSEPILTANSAPPSEPIAPPIANASSLKRVVLIPIASAVCSSSRIAVQARPIARAGEPPGDEGGEAHEREREVVEVLRVAEGEAPDRRVRDSAHPTRPAHERHEPGASDEHRHHLAEAERHQGQIVAAEAEHGRADEQARRRRDQHHDRDREIEVQVARDRGLRRDPVRVQGRPGEQREGVGAEREEEDVAEVEQARIPDHDVQADPEQGEHHHGAEHLGDHGSEQQRCDEQQSQGDQAGDEAGRG